MTTPMLRKVFASFRCSQRTAHCALFIISLLLITPLESRATSPVRVLAAAKTESATESRIVIDFSGQPAFRVKSSDSRVDLVLRNTTADSSFKKLVRDGSLKKMEIGSKNHDLTLTFLLNRSPQRVDSFLTPHDSPADSDPTAKDSRVQLVLVMPWAAARPESAAPAKAADGEVTKSRPTGPTPEAAAKSAALSEKAPAKAPAGRRPASSYRGNWRKFFEDYEVAVSIPPLLSYSLPPFPCLDLLTPQSSAPEDKGTPTAIYQEAIRHGQAGEWGKTVATIEAGMKARANAPPPRLMLLYAEALLHTGAFDKGHELLAALAAAGNPSPENLCARYLAPLAQAAAGKPYDATYELNKLQRGFDEVSPLTPYLQLLRAELALTLGRGQEARRLLAEPEPAGADAAPAMYNLRQADSMAATGRPEEALKSYLQIAAQSDLLHHQPFSLSQLAGLLYERSDFEPALQHYMDLADELPAAAGQDLALYRSAMCQLRSGRQKEAQILLDNIITKQAGSESAFRARLKQADLGVLGEAAEEKKKAAGQTPAVSPADPAALERWAMQEKYLPSSIPTKQEEKKTKFDPAGEYAAIAASAPVRELREEAAFKELLFYHLHNEQSKAAGLLRDFLRTNQNGRLFDEASALQVELLPAAIKELVSANDPITAMTLMEQNRPLLANGQVSSDSLAGLGQSLAGMCLWDQAIKIYLYMFDLARGKAEEEKLYRPLIEACLAGGNYDEVERRAATYERQFPTGSDRARIFCLRLEALKKNNQIDKAASLLRTPNLPESRGLNVFAGRLFFERGEYDEAEKFLDKAIGDDLAKAPPEDVLLRAETLFRAGNSKAAQPLYLHLKDDTAYGDQAVYRLAQIELTTPDNPAGLKLLQGLVEKGNSPLWRKLAAETLATGTF